ncbi:MAG: ATP-binding cassette domain-containing protein [Burkholderiaceae bacterium]|nr:ATP-binding cassette domain-containing protein [Sulfuritalea sp.]MCF8174254.1 ATP-binding cassette domain-containing protein [Burkholderiaceae bacterium]
MSDLKSSARVFVSLLKPYRSRVILAAIALVVAAVAMLGVGQGLRAVIDRGFAAGDPAWLDRALMMMFGVIALLAAATYVRFYNVSWLGERVTADLRRRVFDHLLTLPPSYFEQGRTGAVISRLTADTTLIEQAIGSSLSIALRNLLILIGGLAMLFTTNLKLTLLVLGGVPLVVAPIVLFGRRVRRLARISQDRVADLGNRIDETIHEIRIVQAYGHEEADRHDFAALVERGFRTSLERIRNRATLVVAVLILVFGAISLILWVGGHDVLAGDISPGQLSAFVFYAALVAGAVGALSETWGDLQRTAGATERLLELLAAQPEVTLPANPVPLPARPQGAIQFDDVSFRYPSRPDTIALGNFSLAVSPGETVALVGPSGAGKTTVFQLLLRFYDPQAGRLSLDNIELSTADPLAVRRCIALVPQDAVIFATSALENVRYARPDASPEEVRAACVAAHADEFVSQLPQGYDTDLGERGVRLSGGQRQRIAIARALLADRPILLLDEATSALDAESERLVQAALEKLMKNRSTLVIAHRLATVQKADRIVVMDQGRIVETGTHAELVRQDGLYAHLARLQFAATAQGHPGDPASAQRN